MTTGYDFNDLSSDDQLAAFRTAIAWLRALRAHDSTLAGELLKTVEDKTHMVFGLSMLVGLLADEIPEIDTVLFNMANEAAQDSGQGWPGNTNGGN